MKTALSPFLCCLVLWLAAVCAGSEEARQSGQPAESLQLHLDLVDGSHVVGTPSASLIPLEMPFAKVDVPLARVRRIEVTDGGETASLELRNGDKLSGTVGQIGVGSGSSESFGTSGGCWQPVGPQERGDVNGDGIINVGDVVYLVSYLYKGGPPPDPVIIGDCNCDEVVNVGDVVFLVSYLYKGGPEPVC